MPLTPCQATLTVGDPRRTGRINVRCARTDEHKEHAATLYGRMRTWFGAVGEIVQW